MVRLGLLIVMVLTAWSAPSSAACRCACVNGTMQAVCQSNIDLPPICGASVCAIAPPSIAPIQRPTVPPIGTRSCSQQQVQNSDTGRYEWQTVCR